MPQGQTLSFSGRGRGESSLWSRAEGCDLAVLSFNVQDMHEIREMFRCSVQRCSVYIR